MSKTKKALDIKPTNKHLANPIKKPSILPDAQLLENSTDDIDKPSSFILSQNSSKIDINSAQSIINQLATLSELEYALQRVEIAKYLNNMSVRSLDNLVKKARNREAKNSDSLIADVEPWAECSVDISSVADQIFQIIDDHIACTDAVKVATTLWILMTWLVPASHILPIAWITASEKRCGKSTLLTLISRMSK